MASVTVTFISATPRNDGSGITDITYEYTINCSEEEYQNDTPLAVCVTLIGDDKWYDDTLGGSMDLHPVDCSQGSVSGQRTFPVDTDLLDEDWGDDEIILRLWASDGSSPSASADTSFTGDF